MPEQKEVHFKLLPPPDTLPKFTGEADLGVTYFGSTNYQSGIYAQRYAFGIKRADRARHVYVIGKSGMGKTSLLEQLLRYDIVQGHGVAIIDPHGDLAQHLLEVVPAERLNDVVYVDPSDSEHPIAFNPFANVPVEFRQIVTQNLIEIFKKQFASTWTPRIEHLFRFTALATLEDPEGTLYGFLQLLTDSEYRQRVVAASTDAVVKRFFAIEFASFSQKYDQEAITPLTNRLGQFFADPLMRSIFSQKENKVNFDDIMNNGRIFILNAAKGTLGEDNCALFASFFLTRLSQTAMARTKLPEEERRPFYLYVDEFQNVATETFISLFSESRKYGVNITVANQYLNQIPENLREAIFGNVGTLITFRVGGVDAVRISQELQPLAEPQDLINLGVRDCYIKMSINGKTYPPFSAEVLKLEVISNLARAAQVRAYAQKNFATEPIPASHTETFSEDGAEAYPSPV